MLRCSNYQQKVSHFLIWICLALLLPLTACGEKQSAIPLGGRPANTAPERVSNDTVRVGVLVIDSVESVKQQYEPLLKYLSKVTGRPFSLVPVTQITQFTEVAEGNLEFTINNPLAAVQIRRLHDTQFLVTQSRPNTGTEVGGLIIVKGDSNIKTLEDLRGKSVACVAFQTAAAGCTFQISHLLKQGIDPFLDFSSFVEIESQDKIVLEVLNGTIDAGFIRTGQLEKMQEQGLLENPDQIKVLNSISDKFFYVHTTQLYPEWPIAAVKGTDPELVEAVEKALLNIPGDHPALAAVNVEKFVPAVNYASVDELIKDLGLKSWEAK